MEIKSGELYECPYCGTDQQHMQAEDIDPESWQREVLCMECHRSWRENAAVIEVEIPEEYEAAYKAKHPDEPVIMRQRVFNPQPKPEKKGKK
jgi:hypothetical protein